MTLVRVTGWNGNEKYSYLDCRENIDTGAGEVEGGPFKPWEYIVYLQGRAESENAHSLISAYSKIDERILLAGVSDDARVKFWQVMAESGGLL